MWKQIVGLFTCLTCLTVQILDFAVVMSLCFWIKAIALVRKIFLITEKLLAKHNLQNSK